MQGIRGLLFDKDGTLFDFQQTWGNWAANFINEMATGTAPAPQLAQRLGFELETKTFQPSSIAIAGTIEEIAKSLSLDLPHLSIAEIVKICDEAAAKAELVEAIPLIPFLGSLKSSGYKLGLSTNDAEASAKSHLDSVGILDFFDVVLGYDSGFGAKPEPGMQLAFCDKTSLKASEVAMIGDSTHDLLAGKAAGMQTIGVLTGVAGRDELAPHADLVIDHIGLLPDSFSHPK